MSDSDYANELTYHSHDVAGDIEGFHAAYEAALDDVSTSLGGTYPCRIDGEAVVTDETFTVRSPGDRTVAIGHFAAGGPDEIDAAVNAATEAAPSWADTHWSDRTALLAAAADEMADRKFDLAARITLENGKTRQEAVADVDEAIDFLRYYANELARHDGFAFDTGEPVPGEQCRSVLRPYGVFGVIAPFNFPLAILTGMTAGAIGVGNTAVVKPAEATPSIAHAFMDVLDAAGVPAGVVNLVTGDGSSAGAPLVDHSDIDGIVFTGSRAVGLGIQKRFLELGKRGPVIAELGGKNSVIVTDAADLEKAVSGVRYGAFGFSGQKCSATSRVYVFEDVFDQFVTTLARTSEAIPDQPPTHRDAVLSPVIDDRALERYHDICETAASIGTVHTGGVEASDSSLPDGRYVRPTVVTGVPHEHDLARNEHFLPFVTLHRVPDLNTAIERANDSEFGLCAGLFTEDDDEVETWFQRIEAGMTYVNRANSATTGALVGAQPFGGWKFSGTTGLFAGGRWYLPQFMRQQTQTRVTRS